MHRMGVQLVTASSYQTHRQNSSLGFYLDLDGPGKVVGPSIRLAALFSLVYTSFIYAKKIEACFTMQLNLSNSLDLLLRSPYKSRLAQTCDEAE